MIVDPDFLDHWKTRLLVDLLDGDESAPLYLIRLWAHCQHRRAWVFEKLPPAGLKALCRYPGPADKLEEALHATGFACRDGGLLLVVGWDEHNATLIANWENGKRGGRPPKTTPESQPAASAIATPPQNHPQPPPNNPPETHGFSMANPPPTHGEPIREDRMGCDGIGWDPIREDRMRSDAIRPERTGEDAIREDVPPEIEIERENTPLSRWRPPTPEESKALALPRGIPPETESHREKQSKHHAGPPPPTLDETKAIANDRGIPPEMAEEWWHAREAAEWHTSTGRGGTEPIGTNWKADLLLYAHKFSTPQPV